MQRTIEGDAQGRPTAVYHVWHGNTWTHDYTAICVQCTTAGESAEYRQAQLRAYDRAAAMADQVLAQVYTDEVAAQVWEGEMPSDSMDRGEQDG